MGQIYEIKEQELEEKRVKARERKAKGRANQTPKKRDEERAKSRKAVATKREGAFSEEKSKMRAKAHTSMRKKRYSTNMLKPGSGTGREEPTEERTRWKKGQDWRGDWIS